MRTSCETIMGNSGWDSVGLMGNLLRGREAAQNILIFRYIVATQRLKIMPFWPRCPPCSLRSP